MEAAIKLDLEQTISPIDARIYSSFLEHMGRAVYTGVYEPEHPSADDKGLRQDVLDLIKPLQLPLVRYPGGNFLSGYRWEDGIGPKESRPTRLDLAWHALEPNTFGTDEFMDFCRKAGTEPMLGVNLGTGTPQDAANLVEYCNFPGGSYYSDLRRKNGHMQPYDVKLWCLGNEMDGPWQICAKDAQQYAYVARESAKMMRLVDPTIQLVACGSSNRDMPTFGTWEETVLRTCWEQIDYLSLHQYYACCDGDIPTLLARNLEMDAFIREVADISRKIQSEKQSEKMVYLSFDEWNVWYHWQLEKKESPLWTVGRRLEEEEYTFADALAVGCMINTLIRNADTVKIACLAQLVNVLSAIMTEPGKHAWAQTIYHPFAWASRYGRGTALNARLECPSYSCQIHDCVPYLDVSAVCSEDQKQITLFVINRNLTEDAQCHIQLKQDGAKILRHVTMAGYPLQTANTKEQAPVIPRELAVPEGDLLTILSASWNMIQLAV